MARLSAWVAPVVIQAINSAFFVGTKFVNLQVTIGAEFGYETMGKFALIR
ncbi:hypothetical protein [Campylobacter showae]|nr:hypothetical protein [Campylobacter showae]